METVYSASKLTIIAAAAKSCHDGISESTPPDSISLFSSTEPGFQVIARKPAQSGYHQRRYMITVTDPLATRGWAYQEEFLSSRYVKIATDDVQWKCQVGASCICGESPAERTEPTAETVTMQETWEDIVEDFSRRGLTVETDRLVAFSGIARRFAPIFDDATGFCNPGCFVAPTFSWEINCSLTKSQSGACRPLWRQFRLIIAKREHLSGDRVGTMFLRIED